MPPRTAFRHINRKPLFSTLIFSIAYTHTTPSLTLGVIYAKSYLLEDTNECEEFYKNEVTKEVTRETKNGSL